MKKRIYFENLDGLRFLCFLSVFLFHSFYTDIKEIKDSSIYHFIKVDIIGNGDLGVNFFFVLSGFLITYLLITEKKLIGQIKLQNFWIRRILRIWPLFYFCVFFGFVIFPYLKSLFGQVPNETAHPFYYIFFINNFDFIKNGTPDSSILGVLWSVAIEEQFYLVWPVIIFLFPLKRLWIPFILIIATSLVFRAYNDNYLLREFHTLSCISDMTVGALGAWLINISLQFKIKIETLSKLQICCVYLAFIFVFLFKDELMLESYLFRVFERLFISIIILFIILEQTFSHFSMFKMSNFKKITKLGKITYGLYCLHFIGILIAIIITKKFNMDRFLWQVIWVQTPIALFLTILISDLSYRYFETPFLKIKNRFSIIIK